MLNNKTFLAIIPARGGSKRLPRKNALNLCGKPLIKWTIDAAKKSKYIDEIIVTSDDSEILNISSSCGIKTIKRPNKFATDNSSTFEAVKHAIDNSVKYDYTILLQPTSPIRDENNIDESIELLFKKSANAIVSVCETDHNPLWCNTLPPDGNMCDFISNEVKDKRSQDLKKHFRLNGAIYICKTKRLLIEESFFVKRNIYAFVMQKEESIDIDETIDFLIAESLIRLRLKNA